VDATINTGSDKRAPYPFDYKAKQYRAFTDAALAWSVTDAAQARDAFSDHPAGHWYADDVHTILAEISHRAKRRK